MTKADGTVLRIDQVTNEVAKATRVVRGGAIQIATGDRAVWTVGCSIEPPATLYSPRGFLAKIDTATSKVRSIRVGRCPHSVAVGHGSVWVGDFNVEPPTSTVFRIDPTSGKVVATIAVRGQVSSIAAGESGVWVTTGEP